MKSDPSEYKQIIEKLLDKTRQQRVTWEQGDPDSFRCTIGSREEGAFSFRVTETSAGDDSPLRLTMRDSRGNAIFRVGSTELPTSPEEEQLSRMIEELYELARRQALKVEEKLEVVANLLDQA